jgi:hypothetical protein
MAAGCRCIGKLLAALDSSQENGVTRLERAEAAINAASHWNDNKTHRGGSCLERLGWKVGSL